MCYDMRRFEKVAEEKKRRQKKKETESTVEAQPETIIDYSSISEGQQKG